MPNYETPLSDPAETNSALPDFDQASLWAHEAQKDKAWSLAAERWSVLRAAYPNNIEAWVEAAKCHELNGQLEVALILMSQARIRFPENPSAWWQGALTLAIAGDFSAADVLIAEAEARFPQAVEVHATKSAVMRIAGDHSRARHFARQTVEHFPELPNGYIELAEIAMDAEDWDHALELWEELRHRFPDEKKGYTRAAKAASKKGDMALARQLKIAKRLGNEWLIDLNDQAERVDLSVVVPQRRSLRMFFDLVWTKSRLNLKSEASKNSLQYIWWILDPLLYMTVFYLVFGVLMQRGGEGYIAYLLTGLVPFQWFSKTIQSSSGSIVGGRGLMHKVKISPLFFPLVAITQNIGKQMPVFAMLACFLIFYGKPPTWHWLAVIPLILTQLLFMVFLGCLIAMIVPFIRDVSNLVPTGIQFMMFSSAIFYTIERIPEEWRGVFFLNPMANILYQYRLILVYDQWPEWAMMAGLAGFCAVGLGIVLLLYRRLEGVFPRVVIE